MGDVSAADHEWGCTLLRYFNPVGAHPSGRIGEDPQGVPNNLMPYVAQVAVGRREKLSVYGGDFETEDGTGCRDYIHIMDIAKGHVAAMKQIVEPTFTGVKIYNLGTGTGVTVLQIVKVFDRYVSGYVDMAVEESTRIFHTGEKLKPAAFIIRGQYLQKKDNFPTFVLHFLTFTPDRAFKVLLNVPTCCAFCNIP